MGNNPVAVKTMSHKFVQTLDDQHFGRIQIYKSEQGKFLMKDRRTFIKNEQDSKYHQFKQLLNFSKKWETSKIYAEYFVPVILSENSQQNNLCIVYQIFEIYSEYFNFTLEDMMRNQKEMEISEIWMCFKWLAQLIVILEDQKWGIKGGINTAKIFITLKGKPIIYYHQIGKNQSETILILDQNTKNKRNNIQNIYQQLIIDVAHVIISITCMQAIDESSNIDALVGQCKQYNHFLGELLEKILIIKNDQTELLTAKKILNQIESLIILKKISISKDIKLNKFKCTQKSATNFKQDQKDKKIEYIKIKQLHGKNGFNKQNTLRNLQRNQCKYLDKDKQRPSRLNENFKQLLLNKNMSQRFQSWESRKNSSKSTLSELSKNQTSVNLQQNILGDSKYYYRKTELGMKNINRIQNSIQQIQRSHNKNMFNKSIDRSGISSKSKIF